MKRMASVFVLTLFLAALPAFAKDHSADYQVGIFSTTAAVSDGTYSSASCGTYSCTGSAFSAAHNVHMVTTPQGMYTIETPTSFAATMVVGTLNGGNGPMVHKAWFMDDLHEGDKVLFFPKCDKRNRCTFYLPNPDKTGKEIETQGSFSPNVAKTNTSQLCGSGKLSAAVEAQVCNQAQPATDSAPATAQTPASQMDRVWAIADQQTAASIDLIPCDQIKTMVSGPTGAAWRAHGFPLTWAAVTARCPDIVK